MNPWDSFSFNPRSDPWNQILPHVNSMSQVSDWEAWGLNGSPHPWDWLALCLDYFMEVWGQVGTHFISAWLRAWQTSPQNRGIICPWHKFQLLSLKSQWRNCWKFYKSLAPASIDDSYMLRSSLKTPAYKYRSDCFTSMRNLWHLCGPSQIHSSLRPCPRPSFQSPLLTHHASLSTLH